MIHYLVIVSQAFQQVLVVDEMLKVQMLCILNFLVSLLSVR